MFLWIASGNVGFFILGLIIFTNAKKQQR
jgi:hypothetical protein